MMCVCLDGANWLTFFCQPVKSWNGLILRKPIDMEKRELIQRQEATLLDLRSYLFARQCTLLLFLQRPWEVAQRALELLHSCVQELKLLEVSRLFPISPFLDGSDRSQALNCLYLGETFLFLNVLNFLSITCIVTLYIDKLIAEKYNFCSQPGGVHVGRTQAS